MTSETITSQISTNGLLSFEGPFETFRVCTFPCTVEPVIAPQWTDLDFRTSGFIYYRISQEPYILDQVTDMITDVNPGLSDYQPTLVVIVTWFQAALRSDQSVGSISEQMTGRGGRGICVRMV